MRPKNLLRIASGLILFHLVGHLVGHFTWKDTTDATLAEIILKMETHVFNFMGTQQTLAGHHEGYSLMLAVTLLMLAMVSWTMSTIIDRDRGVGRIGMTMGIFFLVFGVIEMIYFFPLPGITSMLAGACHLTAGWKSSSVQV